jgi:hypothetical protein
VLLEGASTNLTTYSGDTSNAGWLATNVTKTSGQTDPLGGTGASIFAGSGNNLKYLRASGGTTFTSGVAYTCSYFVRNSSSGFVQLTFPTAPFNNTNYANFSLSGNGSVTATVGSVVAQIFKLSNGWYRVSLTMVATNTVLESPPLLILINSGTDARGATTGAQSITAWGCNVVEQDFLSSYINSVASASSRVGDIFRAPVGAENVMLGRDTYGTLVRCDGLGQLAGGSNTLVTPTFLGIKNASILRNSGGAYPFDSFANDTIAPTIFRIMPSGNITTPFSVASTQDPTGRAVSARGSAATKETTYNILDTRIDIGERNGGTNPDYRGYKTVAFGPTRLSDAQLIALSGTI